MRLPHAVFAIKIAASSQGGALTPLFVDRGQPEPPRLPLFLPGLRPANEPPRGYVTRMKALEQQVHGLPGAAADRGAARRRRGGQATPAGGGGGGPFRWPLSPAFTRIL